MSKEIAMSALPFRSSGPSLAPWFGVPVLLALALLGANSTARAEFKVGSKLPQFSLKTVDDTAFSLERKEGSLLITQGGSQLGPKVLVLHLFQPAGFFQGPPSCSRGCPSRRCRGCRRDSETTQSDVSPTCRHWFGVGQALRCRRLARHRRSSGDRTLRSGGIWCGR